MKKDDTKQLILDCALELFAERGYDAVSVGDIAVAVGIKAPSLYNHFVGKEAIFRAIVQSVADRYEQDTGKNHIHVENAEQDMPEMHNITVRQLKEKIRWMFTYSLHDKRVRLFRKLMTREQFRSPELAEMYTARYVDRIVAYHADIFRSLIASGEIVAVDPDALAAMYVAPINQLLGVCDRDPRQEELSLQRLDCHVETFFALIHGETHKNDGE